MVVNLDELNNLKYSRDQIEQNIQNLETKKSQVESGLTVVSPSSKTDVEIKQLQFQKQIAALKKEQTLIDLRYKFSLDKLSEDEYSKLQKQTEDNYQAEIKLLDDNIKQLQNQKEKQSDPYKHITKKQQKNQKNQLQVLKEIRKSKASGLSSLAKTLITRGGAAALVGPLSRVLHSQFSTSNTKIKKLEQLVDNVNLQIDAIKVKDDIIKAKAAVNNALKLLNDAEAHLQKINKLIKTLLKIISILLIVIKILKIALKFVIGPLKAGVQIKIDKVEEILIALLMILGVAKAVLDSLIAFIEELKSRLKQIGDLLDIIASNPDQSLDDLNALIGSSNYGKLGLLDIDYKGWRFVIKEEVNAHYVVQGHKRRYAEAINVDNTPVLKSDASFTLDPQVLVEQLELIIDEQDLKADPRS
jgi:hypothetical protein